MLKNFFTIAARKLFKNKVFSLINILGLTIGLTCCILIALFVYDELSYDHYSEKSKQVYRVELHLIANEGNSDFAGVDVGVGPGMKKDLPEILEATRLVPGKAAPFAYNTKQFKEEHTSYADSNFFRVFSLPFISGDANSALAAPNTIVISTSFAKKYFGKGPALGKLLKYGENTLLKVTGVINDIPYNSHFHFDAFISVMTMGMKNADTWSNVGWYTYLLLDKNADAKKLEAKFPQLVAKYVVPEVQHDMGTSLAEAQKAVNTFIFQLMPLRDIHLHGNAKFELEANGDIRYVYIFSALAVFILFLACVNFTNLSTASAAGRAKEVGIRKVIGSLKNQLVAQFLAESILLTLCAMILAVLLVYTLLPFFNQLSGKNISFGFFLQPWSIIALLILVLLTGTLAGIYPAFFLSSFKVINVLKGSKGQQSRRSLLRSSLVVFQFAVSTALIIATVVVYEQLHYMQNKKLGYDKDQVLVLPESYNLRNNEMAFKDELLHDNRIANTSISWMVPVSTEFNGTVIYAKPQNEHQQHSEIYTNLAFIDYDYLSTLGIHLAYGRNFSKDFADSNSVIINETAARDMGLDPTKAVGQSIIRSGQHEFQIVGLVHDFNFTTAKKRISPMILLLGRNVGNVIVKIKTQDAKQVLASIKNRWDTYNTGIPFSYYFLDEHFAALYKAEEKTGQIFSLFAIVAVLIACLGLFGLAAFTTEQRSKEIGIRKVLGATVQQMILLLTREFLWLIVIAFVVAVPITWWAMHTWLEDFAYRIEIRSWIFIVAGLVTLIISMLTVSYEAVKAAIANPVKSMRTE